MVSLTGEDRYNFNPHQHDVATGAPDNDNGRFTEIGWAKPFDTHGSLPEPSPGSLATFPTRHHPHKGGSDREPRGHERDRGSTPDNPREQR